jgi:tryptophan-rich sensory protein
MKQTDFLKLITTIAISELAGLIGSSFTISAITTWYTTLNKPTFNPPSWIFAPTWTTLYALMGIAAFLIWKKGCKQPHVKRALIIFLVQLTLNALWSIIFFGLHSPGKAFIEIIFLWIAIIATIITFTKISRTAAWLLAPYILWVSFAAYLNFAIWLLNK